MSLHTMPGAIMGTLEYMAPEQTRGEPADGRTDIYAFGLILYELVAGGRPRISREGGMAELIARLEKGPPPLRSVVPDVPDDVERIVETCLQRNPADRYATADDLLADLDRLDAEGRPLPLPKRVPRWQVLTAAAVLGALLVTGTWWAASNRVQVPPTQRPAVPVLIVDFENRARDPVFDGALEQVLSIAMEGAPFITAYPRRDATNLVRSLKLGDKLDDTSGRLVATREGIRVILVGSIERDGGGYRVAVRAIDPEKPEPPIAVADAKASEKRDVLGAVGQVADQLREALGDRIPTDRQNAETFTTASLDAIREYTVAQDLSADQKDEEAIPHYQAAITSDPEFGRAYAGLATSLHYLGRRDDSARAWEDAIKRLDRMSEREQLRTMEYATRSRATTTPRSMRTRTSSRGIPPTRPGTTISPSRSSASSISPVRSSRGSARSRSIQRVSSIERTTRYMRCTPAISRPPARRRGSSLPRTRHSRTSYLPLAMEALAAGDFARARTAYEQAAKGGTAGASLAAIGLADIAMYQGRYDDAVAALPEAIAQDTAQKNVFGAVAKLLALAEAHAALGRSAASQAALTQARALGEDDSILVTTARLSIAAGRFDAARAVAAELGARLPAQSRAYGKLIEAELLMAAKPPKTPEAIDALNAAKKLGDLWLVRYVSGLATARRYEAAASEFAKCHERRGEATARVPRRTADVPLLRSGALLAGPRTRGQQARSSFAVRGLPRHPRRRGPGSHGDRRPATGRCARQAALIRAKSLSRYRSKLETNS